MNCTGLKKLLEGFVEKDCIPSEYPSELDELLTDTARTGVVRFSWNLLKPLLKFRLELVLKSEVLAECPRKDDEDLANLLAQRLDTFDNPPFTIQRVCELVVHPKQHYKRRDRYMRAVEKNLMVVSTQAPDLTWMKSPRLTQLLEQPTTDINNDISNHNHTPTSLDNCSLLEQPKGSPGSNNSEPSAPEDMQDLSSGPALTRKRTVSLRDNLEKERGCGEGEEKGRGTGEEDRGCGKGEEEVMGLVLQEADSTTIEHSSQLPDGNEIQDSNGNGTHDSSEDENSHVSESRDGNGTQSACDGKQMPGELRADPGDFPLVPSDQPEAGAMNCSTRQLEDGPSSITLAERTEREEHSPVEDIQASVAKKIKLFEAPREDGDMLTSSLEVGGARVEPPIRKDTYKEAATGQLAPSDNDQDLWKPANDHQIN